MDSPVHGHPDDYLQQRHTIDSYGRPTTLSVMEP